ncbi:hypothetical protein V6N13_029814 [Hibiscus sabdariffa]|uniref:Uncharacterized protein n=1 Tax=Hibiscus sabdariffa TaxID=183260 RepID=A0ABR1ZIS8_9ROSI
MKDDVSCLIHPGEVKQQQTFLVAFLSLNAALGYPNNNPLLVLQIVDHVVFTSTKGEKQTTVRRPSETCCWVHSIQIPKGCRR